MDAEHETPTLASRPTAAPAAIPAGAPLPTVTIGEWTGTLWYADAVEMYAGLQMLSARRLATPANENRVLALLRRFRRTHEIVEDQKSLNFRRHPAPDGYESDDLPMALIEIRQSLYEDLLRLPVTELRDVPSALTITDDDMPVNIKGELGHQNRYAVADIKRKLGVLYVGTVGDPDDEEA